MNTQSHTVQIGFLHNDAHDTISHPEASIWAVSVPGFPLSVWHRAFSLLLWNGELVSNLFDPQFVPAYMGLP